MKRVLITGAAGFIGFHVALSLLKRGDRVIGVDNLNDYYDVNLKRDRLEKLRHSTGSQSFRFIKADLANQKKIEKIFQEGAFDVVVHLAAQAGVRYSLKNPHAYINSNIVGFMNILEGCRYSKVKHLVFASSSSVYGNNARIPFSESDNVDHPISLYAASKKANELMAHTYAYLYGLPCTGLRFFTVYGPWGRPDMACFLFTKAILAGKPIDVFNFGNMKRDFTYIDDVVEGVVRIAEKIPQLNPDWDREKSDPGSSCAPYKLYNIGNHHPVDLAQFIEMLETQLGKKAIKNLLPIQPGDVPATYADVDNLMKDIGFQPSTPIEVGIQRFVEWYRAYYHA